MDRFEILEVSQEERDKWKKMLFLGQGFCPVCRKFTSLDNLAMLYDKLHDCKNSMCYDCLEKIIPPDIKEPEVE